MHVGRLNSSPWLLEAMGHFFASLWSAQHGAGLQAGLEKYELEEVQAVEQALVRVIQRAADILAKQEAAKQALEKVRTQSLPLHDGHKQPQCRQFCSAPVACAASVAVPCAIACCTVSCDFCTENLTWGKAAADM
jgi:hypothetical protein